MLSVLEAHAKVCKHKCVGLTSLVLKVLYKLFNHSRCNTNYEENFT